VTGDQPSISGRKLGNYELIEAVGAGGMAAVLKARDLELGRIVALKILPPESARDPESINRFKQEARAAARLDHENVARVYACGEDQGLYFIAFEFVEGVNLRQMIDRRGTIPPAECVRYMIQVAAGLNHAAERGVVHRDIKPSNIVITPDGRAKIVDMGLARQLEAGSVNGELTHSGVTLGTFDYISPEQALDPRRADVRSDIYSLGCAFYHALTGRPPVPEGTAAKKLHAHQHTAPLDPRQINPNIPDELAAILARMMAKDPEQRYQSPMELISHLKGLVERLKLSPEVVGQDSVVQSVPAELSVLPQPPRLRLGWVLAAAAIAVAVTAFAMSTGDPGHGTVPPWDHEFKDPKTFTTPDLTVTTPTTGAPTDDVVRTEEDLVAKLADPNTTKVRLAPGTFDLTKLPTAVVFQGNETKDLELTGSVSPPTILQVHDGALAPGTNTQNASALPAGSFYILGGKSVSITGIQFRSVSQTSKLQMGAALCIADSAQITLTDCVFAGESTRRLLGRLFLAGNVRVTGHQSKLLVQRCVFAPGNFGLMLPDEQCDATIFDCGFGPHDVAVQVGDGTAPVLPEGKHQNIKIRLERSSFMLDPESAVVANPGVDRDDSSVEVSAAFCVFAHVPQSNPAPFFPGGIGLHRPVVIRAQTTRPGEITFKGQGGKNAYYSVVPLSTPDNGGTRYYTFEECKGKFPAITDDSAVTLTRWPWEEADPLSILTDTKPWRAFRLKLTELDVFIPGDYKIAVIGAQFHNSDPKEPWRAYPGIKWPPERPKSPAAPEQRTLIWYPESQEDPLPPNTYTDLAALLRKAQSGDVILIRTRRTEPEIVPIEKVEVKSRGTDASTFKVTFKPYPGCQPILTVPGAKDPTSRDLDQTLFLIHSGSARFEGLQFLLKPSQPKDPQRVAAVQLIGAESCSFVDCVFTLAEEDDAKATVAHVLDPKQVMVMAGGNPSTAKMKFERCLIRGRGRGIWLPVNRTVEIDLTQSITALNGPVFFAEPDGKPPSVKSVLRFNRVTVFVGGPLIELHGGKVGEMRTSGLSPLEVHTDECLFASVPFAGRSLVEFDGIDPPEATKLLQWVVNSANRYANFPDGFVAMLVRPATDGTTLKETNWDLWISMIGERDGKPVGKVTFENAPAGLEKLASFKPADAVIKMVDFLPDLPNAKPTDAGADPKTLPTPFNEP
jgi:serine/threonine protein kinase